VNYLGAYICFTEAYSEAFGYAQDGFALKNTASDGSPGYGHAVYIGCLASSSAKRVRDATADERVMLSSEISGSLGGWD
jgi:hypothetical protein